MSAKRYAAMTRPEIRAAAGEPRAALLLRERRPRKDRHASI